MAFAVGHQLFNQPRAPFTLFYIIDPAIRRQLNLKNHYIGNCQIRDFSLLQLQQVSQDNSVHTLVESGKMPTPEIIQSLTVMVKELKKQGILFGCHERGSHG